VLRLIEGAVIAVLNTQLVSLVVLALGGFFAEALAGYIR
jgi:hypothetical protein